MEHSMPSMKMTAMESLKDPNMAYLDLISGVGGATLAMLINNGVDNFNIQELSIRVVPLVLIARVIVDFLYSKLISETEQFGGSNLEIILSSIVWLVLVKLVVPDVTNKQIAVLYLSTALVMLATARVTHWG
jgi:FlaA1/EpsC-like NDP-sugar epimerase